MSWSWDRVTRRVVPDPGQEPVMTAEEFARRRWPPCPECGKPLQVARVWAPRLNNRDRYQAGTASCPGDNNDHLRPAPR